MHILYVSYELVCIPYAYGVCVCVFCLIGLQDPVPLASYRRFHHRVGAEHTYMIIATILASSIESIEDVTRSLRSNIHSFVSSVRAIREKERHPGLQNCYTPQKISGKGAREKIIVPADENEARKIPLELRSRGGGGCIPFRRRRERPRPRKCNAAHKWLQGTAGRHGGDVECCRLSSLPGLLYRRF